MGFRNLRYRDSSEEATFDLNLAPMMDMLVSIIPFMLLSATFMSIMVISVPLPQSVQKALADDRAKTERDVSISIVMSPQHDFAIDVKDEKGKPSKFTVPRMQSQALAGGSDYNYRGLHKVLVEIKQRFPKVFRVDLNPDEGVPYNSLVLAMDESRNMDVKDPKVLIDGSATPLLFPDVVLANIMN
jgi:biopolymer transport protein ExbD